MKLIVKIIIAVLALVVIAGGTYLLLRNKPVAADAAHETAPVSPFFSQNIQTVSAMTAHNLKIAKTKAQEWKNDADFVAMSLGVPTNLTTTTTTQTFIFGALSDPVNWWTVSIDSQEKFVRALVPKMDFLGANLKTIQENLWQKSFLEALQIAEINGGLAFRAANPEAQISLSLEQTQPNDWLWWKVSYQGAQTNLKIMINAFDGRIYDEQGNPLQSNSSNGQNSSSTKSEIK